MYQLKGELNRAGNYSKAWVINSSLYEAGTTNKLLKAKASNEIEWINKIYSHANGNIAIIPWIAEEIKGEKLNQLLL